MLVVLKLFLFGFFCVRMVVSDSVFGNDDIVIGIGVGLFVVLIMIRINLLFLEICLGIY